ncbi:RloB family protein [Viscerimonas tarda]
MRKSKNIPPKGNQFAFVVDGKCELWYMQMLKQNERTINIALKPELPQKKKLAEQYDRVIELSKDYDKVFWILDLDVIIKETREASNGTKAALQELEKYHKKIAKNGKCKNIVIILNNPCLEYWYLLHFEATSKYFDSCAKLLPELKKHKELADYEKTEKYYKRPNHDIYTRLKPYLPKAIANANKLKAFDFDNVESGLSEMQLLYEEDGIKQILEVK